MPTTTTFTESTFTDARKEALRGVFAFAPSDEDVKAAREFVIAAIGIGGKITSRARAQKERQIITQLSRRTP